MNKIVHFFILIIIFFSVDLLAMNSNTTSQLQNSAYGSGCKLSLEVKLKLALTHHVPQQLKEALNAGANIYYKVQGDMPVFHLLFREDQSGSSLPDDFYQCLEILNEAKVDWNIADSWKRSVLYKTDDASTIEYLIKKGANPNVLNAVNILPVYHLMTAWDNCSLPLVKIFLQSMDSRYFNHHNGRLGFTILGHLTLNENVILPDYKAYIEACGLDPYYLIEGKTYLHKLLQKISLLGEGVGNDRLKIEYLFKIGVGFIQSFKIDASTKKVEWLDTAEEYFNTTIKPSVQSIAPLNPRELFVKNFNKKHKADNLYKALRKRELGKRF